MPRAPLPGGEVRREQARHVTCRGSPLPCSHRQHQAAPTILELAGAAALMPERAQAF
jgi:hypothetical protein